MGKPGNRERSRWPRKSILTQAAGLGLLGSGLLVLAPYCGGGGGDDGDGGPARNSTIAERPSAASSSSFGLNLAHGAVEPQSKWLDSLTVYLRREDNDELGRTMPMVRASRFRSRHFRPLLDGDDFRFDAEFRNSSHWFVLWVDSKGGAKVEAFSSRPDKQAHYPQLEQGVVNVNPADPAGVHLIALAAGSAPPDETALDRAFAGLTPPPADLADPADLAGRGWMPEWETHPFIEELKRRLSSKHQFCFMLAVPAAKPNPSR